MKNLKIFLDFIKIIYQKMKGMNLNHKLIIILSFFIFFIILTVKISVWFIVGSIILMGIFFVITKDKSLHSFLLPMFLIGIILSFLFRN